MKSDSDLVLSATKMWLERAVIGLNLCPFAKSVYVRDQIQYVVSSSSETKTMDAELEHLLLDLALTPADQRDTTLLIAPRLWSEFHEMLIFLKRADRLLCRLRLDGVIQIASFHPKFQFAGTQESDIENFTNRSPYPILHLLREDSVERAVRAMADPRSIYEANIATLKALGQAGWDALRQRPSDGR